MLFLAAAYLGHESVCINVLKRFRQLAQALNRSCACFVIIAQSFFLLLSIHLRKTASASSETCKEKDCTSWLQTWPRTIYMSMHFASYVYRSGINGRVDVLRSIHFVCYVSRTRINGPVPVLCNPCKPQIIFFICRFALLSKIFGLVFKY